MISIETCRDGTGLAEVGSGERDSGRVGGVIPRMKGEDALNATGGMGLMVVGRLSRRMNRFKENG